MLKEAAPLPLPLAPDATVIHDAPDVAVQAQPAVVVTLAEKLPTGDPAA